MRLDPFGRDLMTRRAALRSTALAAATGAALGQAPAEGGEEIGQWGGDAGRVGVAFRTRALDIRSWVSSVK
jgi:hypothetical protein